MARIDSFLAQLIAYEADALVVEAGDNLYLLKGEARQALMQVKPGAIANAHVKALLEEIAPPEVRACLEFGDPVAWEYGWSSCVFKVEVAVVDGRLLARLRTVKSDTDVVVVGGNNARDEVDVDEAPAGLQRFLLGLVEAGGSDLHLTPGRMPMARVDGELIPLQGCTVLDAYGLQKMIEEVLPPAEKRAFEAGADDVTFAWSVDGARVRATVFRDHNGWCAVLRRFLRQVPSIEALGLPEGIEALCDGAGLVVVAGATGSGRSTTVAALLDRINSTRAVHVITFEEPVEVIHPAGRALINQRKAGPDRGRAVRAAAREDVDVIVVGDLDEEGVVEACLEAADAGVLVIATAVAKTAALAVERVVGRCAKEKRERVRALLGDNLRAVLCQSLCKKVGGGRVVAVEVLGGTVATADAIRKGEAVDATVSLNDALREFVSAGVIARDEAIARAADKGGYVDDVIAGVAAEGQAGLRSAFSDAPWMLKSA